MRTLLMALTLASVSTPAMTQGLEPRDDEGGTQSARAPVPDEAYKPAVRARMEFIARDPTSLVYDWGLPPRMGWTDMAGQPRYEGLVGCVRVRGRNGFGGYGRPITLFYVVDTATGEAHGFQTFGDQVPRVGRFISHDPGCPR